MTKYLKWKGASDAGFFSYYDKETETNNKFELKDIAVDSVSYTVVGWDEASNSNIYSNDITSFTDEEFTVRAGKGWEIAKGIYKDIKEAIINAGAKLHIKIVGEANGEAVQITLKWLNYFQLSTVLKEIDIKKDLLSFSGTEDDKKGAVKFKKTIFKKGGERKASEKVDEDNLPF